MRLHTPLLALLATAALTTAALASSPTPGAKPWESQDGPSPTRVIVATKHVIKAIEEDGTLVLADEDGGAERRLRIGESIKLTAAHKQDFDGRKKIAFRDLAVGQRIKVTRLADTGEVLRIKVLETAGEA